MTRDEKLEQLKRVEVASQGLEQQMRRGVEQSKDWGKMDFAAVFSALSSSFRSISILTKAVIKLIEMQDDE